LACGNALVLDPHRDAAGRRGTRFHHEMGERRIGANRRLIEVDLVDICCARITVQAVRGKLGRPSSPNATSSPSTARRSGRAASSGSSGVMSQPRLLTARSRQFRVARQGCHPLVSLLASGAGTRLGRRKGWG
jgi:hypothetical protein